ncbi:hypothetical protein TIFTF001_002268 [Ficus carica]|uniref:Uncharacterized protein n=1 Tax=Ficus carica TaxID=3494 RepID=A0AA88CRX3_FICCA|nr:hypothetical protein TIFTF001_002268 [Ficus carica]
MVVSNSPPKHALNSLVESWGEGAREVSVARVRKEGGLDWSVSGGKRDWVNLHAGGGGEARQIWLGGFVAGINGEVVSVVGEFADIGEGAGDGWVVSGLESNDFFKIPNQSHLP